jgi:hypothetical protein
MGASIVTILFIEFYTDIAWIWYVLIGTFVTFFVGYLFPAKQLSPSPSLSSSGENESRGH